MAITKLPHLNKKQFQEYWRDHHAPIILAVADDLGIRRYVQLETLPSESGLNSTFNKGFDGIAEVWFDNVEAVIGRNKDPKAQQARLKVKNDEQFFIDSEKTLVWWSEENIILS